MELELIEPSLFLDNAPDGGVALLSLAESARKQPLPDRRGQIWRPLSLQPLNVDLCDQRIQRAAALARCGLQRAPEHRLQADRRLDGRRSGTDLFRRRRVIPPSRGAINTCAGRR